MKVTFINIDICAKWCANNWLVSSLKNKMCASFEQHKYIFNPHIYTARLHTSAQPIGDNQEMRLCSLIIEMSCQCFRFHLFGRVAHITNQHTTILNVNKNNVVGTQFIENSQAEYLRSVCHQWQKKWTLFNSGAVHGFRKQIKKSPASWGEFKASPVDASTQFGRAVPVLWPVYDNNTETGGNSVPSRWNYRNVGQESHICVVFF